MHADIYSFGKVLYEISTGNDRLQYPELPANLGKRPEDRDLIKFNKIILQACRAVPRARFKTAEEMMAAMLAFQFGVWQSRKLRTRQLRSNAFGILGAITAASVIIGILGRRFRLLNQGP